MWTYPEGICFTHSSRIYSKSIAADSWQKLCFWLECVSAAAAIAAGFFIFRLLMLSANLLQK
jgi:cytochrome b subunit of formate dehydrogenase